MALPESQTSSDITATRITRFLGEESSSHGRCGCGEVGLEEQYALEYEVLDDIGMPQRPGLR